MSIKSYMQRIMASSDDPRCQRLKQYLLTGGIILGGIGVYTFVQHARSERVPSQKVSEKETVPLSTPYEAVSSQEMWVNRVHKEAELAKSEAKAVRDENQMLAKKIDVMEKLFQSSPSFKAPSDRAASGDPDVGAEAIRPQDPKATSTLDPVPLQGGTGFAPPEGFDASVSSQRSSAQDRADDKLFGVTSESVKSSKFLSLSLPQDQRSILKNTSNYVPAGSYARAVLTSGVVASTALQSSAHPQPIVMRLIDDGHLPRGFRSTMNQNVLIGACYGDLSAERVLCRLETMAWVEENGVTVEKKVEGWIIGEDGRPGLRGEVVDRSGDAVKDTMIAGLLSGLGQFLRADATSSVYPVSPFGQTNALSSGRALTGAATQGASSALDKLAEFSIKRAEQMQPVILIASGRVVDVVFKQGVDIRPEIAVHNPNLALTPQSQPQKETTHAPY